MKSEQTQGKTGGGGWGLFLFLFFYLKKNFGGGDGSAKRGVEGGKGGRAKKKQYISISPILTPAESEILVLLLANWSRDLVRDIF